MGKINKLKNLISKDSSISGITFRLRKALNDKMNNTSFYKEIERRKKIHYNFREHLEGVKPPVYWFETKQGQKKLIANTGISFSRTLEGPFPSVEKFNLDDLPTKFCLKPNFGSSSNGVFLLKKYKNNSLVDIRSNNKFYNINSLNGMILNERSLPFGIIAEEILESDYGLPCDFKFYTFYGEMGILMQVDRSRGRQEYKFYDSDCSPLRNIADRKINNDLRPPKNFKLLKQAALKISKILPTPFVRVDLYEVNNQPYFGEFALRPGQNQLFTKGIDELLGKLWESSECKLMSELGEKYIP